MDARRYIVTGRVQGVGFRWHTRRLARGLNLTGWVKNLSDGSVEIWAEGQEVDLASLKEALDRGPSGAIVKRVDEMPAQATGRYFQFEITY